MELLLNNFRIENLIKYLQMFPPDASITIWHDYKEYDCRICCNFDHQKKENVVQLMIGDFICDS